MTSIDDLFKGANSSTKRKFENPSAADPTNVYKAAKLSPESDVKQTTQASVTDGYDEDDEEEEAGPALPPDLDDGAGDDEDGRFFSGGMDEDAKDAMDFLDAQDGDNVVTEEKYNVSWLRKLALNFEKKANKNASLRAKYENDPAKFMESEADLDEAIKGLSILSEHAELYRDFATTPAASKLVELLAHDNNDIAICAIEIISELTDEDVEVEQEQWDTLVSAFLDADLLGLLVSNFSRFDEKDPADASGVYHSLSVIENILSQPVYLEVVGKDAKLLTWLLNRTQEVEQNTSQNKQYVSEILSILTQSSRPNRTRVIQANGVEIFLTQLAPYRKNDPQKESAEEEYMENMFNCLTSLADEPEGKNKFLEAEGVELCLLMVRDGKTSKSRSLKVLDHACGFAEPMQADDARTNGDSKSKSKGHIESAPNPSVVVCDKVIEARGLRPLFSTFMKTKKHDPEMTEHILGIFASLFRWLPGNSDSRLRVLAKFLDKNFEKITKLVNLRRDYVARVKAFDEQIQDRKKGLSKEEQEEVDLESTPARLDEGLYCLERIDAVLAWLVAEDDGAKRAIVKALAERDETLGDVQRTLRAQLDGLLEVEPTEREMLETLVGFIR